MMMGWTLIWNCWGEKHISVTEMCFNEMFLIKTYLLHHWQTKCCLHKQNMASKQMISFCNNFFSMTSKKNGSLHKVMTHPGFWGWIWWMPKGPETIDVCFEIRLLLFASEFNRFADWLIGIVWEGTWFKVISRVKLAVRKLVSSTNHLPVAQWEWWMVNQSQVLHSSKHPNLDCWT